MENKRFMQKVSVDETKTQNKYGEWITAIPEPYNGLVYECSCGRFFFIKRNYMAHYALEHILSYK